MKSNSKVIIGIFAVPGYGPDTVETPLTGNPQRDYLTLAGLIAKRHPKMPKGTVARRTGSVIETRDPSNAFVELTPGVTIAQLFEDRGEDTTRTVGRVFYSGSTADIVLVFAKAQGTVAINLRPLLRADGVIRFHNKIGAHQLASGLPLIIKEVLGTDARGLVLNFREKKPASKV